MKQGAYVYILMNKLLTVTYIGVTSELGQRMWQHKNKTSDGFTKKYNCNQLVYYEFHEEITEAIAREKKVKRWNHAWKMNLIQRMNPTFQDLSESLGL